MDVSRIEAYNPNKINWRNMTAKEILKCREQGQDVPNMYVQWAQEFIKQVHGADEDSVTYEVAKSEKYQKINKDKVPEAQNAAQNVSETEEENVDHNLNAETQNLTPAQLKRYQMEQNSTSLRTQAKTFTVDSKNSKSNAVMASAILSLLNSQSNDEIQNLEAAMEDILAEAENTQNELKKNVNDINQERSDNSTLDEINRLNAELLKMGTSAQSQITGTEASLISAGGTIDSLVAPMDTSIDFGTQTSDIGNELIKYSQREISFWRLIDIIVGRAAINNGDAANNAGKNGLVVQKTASDDNNSNISTALSLRNSVENKTGVVGVSAAPKNDVQQEQQSDVSENVNEEKSANNENSQNTTNGDKSVNSFKDENSQVDDGTDTESKITTNIDEILKRKIRRGEYDNSMEQPKA